MPGLSVFLTGPRPLQAYAFSLSQLGLALSSSSGTHSINVTDQYAAIKISLCFYDSNFSHKKKVDFLTTKLLLLLLLLNMQHNNISLSLFPYERNSSFPCLFQLRCTILESATEKKIYGYRLLLEIKISALSL